ncbi:hypothetical protein [Capnocytophaga sp. CM59]|uniref:hypothetical protein n=1 Tax=Capnocytophaga sp. CM59 TaxID=936370 RepID=UPI0005578E60|nr:hypothetical protein [Capnocytophaga sp. CM59]
MKTVFKKGMKVYDSVFFPKSEGKVVEIDKRVDCERVIVQFDCLDYKLSYTEQGRLTSTHNEAVPTLSTSPYTFQGFEQKAPTPTYEEAEEWMKKEYVKGSICLMMRDVFEALEALRKLIVLRDYYNEGWQPDWSKKNRMHFCIRVRNNKITKDSNSDINEFNAVLVFSDYTIRDKFLEEQKELLEIAKPLL